MRTSDGGSRPSCQQKPLRARPTQVQQLVAMEGGTSSRSAVACFEDLRPRPAPACTMAAATAFAVFVCYALLNQPAEPPVPVEEPAHVASPRTPWSSRSANQSRKWTAYQASLVSDASAYQSGKSSRLVLVGDSITEAWLGTGYGSPASRAEGVPAVLNATLARQWPPTPLVLGISGDQTQHVLWRIAQGEVSKAMASQHGQSRSEQGHGKLAQCPWLEVPSCLRTAARRTSAPAPGRGTCIAALEPLRGAAKSTDLAACGRGAGTRPAATRLSAHRHQQPRPRPPTGGDRAGRDSRRPPPAHSHARQASHQCAASARRRSMATLSMATLPSPAAAHAAAHRTRSPPSALRLLGATPWAPEESQALATWMPRGGSGRRSRARPESPSPTPHCLCPPLLSR